MRSLSTKLLLLSLATILMVGGTMGCAPTNTDISMVGRGFAIGFENKDNFQVKCAVQSEYSVFSVDGVSLDFYYGKRGNADTYGKNGIYGTDICFALYFVNAKYKLNSYNSFVDNAGVLHNTYQNHQNIDNLYFMRDIPTNEFNSDDYWHTWTQKNHHRSIQMMIWEEVI